MNHRAILLLQPNQFSLHTLPSTVIYAKTEHVLDLRYVLCRLMESQAQRQILPSGDVMVMSLLRRTRRYCWLADCQNGLSSKPYIPLTERSLDTEPISAS